MKSELVIGGVLMLAAVGAASAADLSPATDSTPTVETEIKRGMDAESTCDGALVAAEYAHCIFSIENKNRQRLLDYNPFDIGLFFRAWVVMDARGNPGNPADTDEAKQVAAAALHQAASMYTVYRAYQKKVGVTDDFVIAVSGMSQSLVESRIAFWDSQPP
jgi:hypothetical protein